LLDGQRGGAIRTTETFVCRTYANARLALAACGLDPGLAFIHTDTPARDSLALDLLESERTNDISLAVVAQPLN
jgi:hypothetical protein